MEIFIKQTRDPSYKNIGSKSYNDLTVNGHTAENEIVPLQQIHSITFEHSTQLSPTGKLSLSIAKGNSSSYNISSNLTGKKSLLLSKSSIFIQKEPNCWVAHE